MGRTLHDVVMTRVHGDLTSERFDELILPFLAAFVTASSASSISGSASFPQA
jgi:hypothetical protein